MVKPSECNAKQELPLTMLVSQIIDLATDHANQLGIGFLNLSPRGMGWVLSRLSVEMRRWPKNGEEYVLATWIECYNPHFSERCFSITTKEGEILGYCRTTWVIIDLLSHKSMGTAGTVMPPEMIPGHECPIRKMTRHKPITTGEIAEYTFKYCDLDFYRHVNTVRYISILLNLFTLKEMDEGILSRFDIAFSNEAKYGETAEIKMSQESIENPPFMSEGSVSTKRNFEMNTGDRHILSASVTLTR